MRRILLICICAISLASCANNSKEELKVNAGAKTIFVVNENYQMVYRRVYEATKKCFSGGGLPIIGSQMRVDGQLFSDLGFGEITTFMDDMQINYFSMVRIERNGHASRIHVYVSNAFFNPKTAITFFESASRQERRDC